MTHPLAYIAFAVCPIALLLTFYSQPGTPRRCGLALTALIAFAICVLVSWFTTP